MPNFAIHFEFSIELKLHLLPWRSNKKPAAFLAFTEIAWIARAGDSSPTRRQKNSTTAYRAITRHYLLTVLNAINISLIMRYYMR